MLNQASAQEMLTSPIPSDFAMGLQRYGRTGDYFGYEDTRAGFQCVVFFHKDLGLGTVVMSNTERFEHGRDTILHMIAVTDRWPDSPN